MYLPLRMKFLLVAGGVAIIALGSSMWALSYQLEKQLAVQITGLLSKATTTFTDWKKDHQDHLKAEALIVAYDPRFFAAVADGDAATTIPVAREFQHLAHSQLLLVCDHKGRRLAHLDPEGQLRALDWPRQLPPTEPTIRYGSQLYLLQTQPVTVGPDTVGFLSLGLHVDSVLAKTIGDIAGADVLFYDDAAIYGATLSPARAGELMGQLRVSGTDSGEGDTPATITVHGERFLYRLGNLAGGEGGRYAVVMSLDERLKPRLADVRRTLAGVGTFALALAVAISWSVARHVTGRVPQLVAAVEAVARGDYQRPVSHVGHDEFQQLAVAVDRMRHDLAAQMEAIRKANAEKITTERLAVIGKMSSTIIHDFKTPMQVIRTAVELATNENAPVARRSHYAGMIMSELDRMVSMAQDLLGFARGERRMARTPVDLDEMLTQAVASWQQICFDKGITVAFTPGAGIQVALDRDRILRTLDNIVINATEALTAGGVISIRTECDPRWVRLHVADTGPGIPKEIQAKIFEPFASFGKTQGTGLGLAMARKTVEDHGGQIDVQSAPGSGTTFTIALPYSQDGLAGMSAGMDEARGVRDDVVSVA